MSALLFELRKLIPDLLMPVSLSLILTAIGLLRKQRAFLWIAALVLLLSSLPAVADSLNRFLESQYPHLSPAQCPAADAIVPLAGFASAYNRFPGEISWDVAAGRFQSAIELYRLKKAPAIILTRPEMPDDRRLDHPIGELSREAAIADGVPESAIHLTGPVATTADEAEAVKAYLAQNGAHRIILVTSALHMRRAAYLFHRAGVDFIPFPTDYQADSWQWKADNFVPSAEALYHEQLALHEIYGDLFYGILPFAAR